MMNKEDNKPVATFFPSLKHIQFFGISINSIYSPITSKLKFALYNYGKNFGIFTIKILMTKI